METTIKSEDNLGTVLVQVQDDLRQLRCRLEKITVSEAGKALDIQVLDNTIQKTESSIRKHAEDYLKKINEQLQVLPGIEELPSKKIPKWKPSMESFPDVHPRKEDLPRVSPREKPKSLLAKPLRHDPAHPNNRAVVFRKYGLSLPDVHNKNTIRSKDHRIVTSLAVRPQVFGPKGRHSLAKPEEATGTDRKMLHRLIQHKAVSLHLKEDSHSAQIDSRSRSYKQLQWEPELGSTCEKTSIKCTPLWMTKTPPPSTTSRSVHHGIMMQSTIDLNPQNLPRKISRFTFTITNGRLNPMEADFCHFRQSFSLCWSSVVCALEALQKLLRNFAVPLAKVSGERLVEFAYGWDNGWRRAPQVISLLSVLENWEEVWSLVLRPGQRYKGEGGVEAAAIHIQSCWRRYIARTAYLSHCRRKWAAGTIAISWLMHAQMRRVRRALQARRFRQLENYRSRAQHLAANWKHIQSSKRTIIHIPSLGYSESERRKLRRFDVLQNIQINRLCEIRDENVEVIYICPRHLGEDVLHYQTSLLKCDGASDGSDTKPAEASSRVRRFIILTPEAVDYFPTHNMCLSTLLKYSPRTLKRIRNLIQGKESYIVGGVAHMDDLAVADELGVPILGPEPTISLYHSTKSGGRRIFTGAEVDVPPGQGDVYSLSQFHETLADLMAENFDVKRWLFKIDSEHSGRGTAFCDVRHLSCHDWAQQQYCRHGPELWKTKWIQEPVFLRYLDEIPEWLTRYAQPAKTSCYPNWACFLKTFLRQGGVVEAYPPSDSVTCLTVDLLLEPGGEVTMLSCGDQLHGSCQLEAIGSTVPQTSVHPETLRSICMRVGQACLQRHIVGYVSVDLATFLNRSTMEQKVWAIDLDLRYSDQLAMTQMLLMTTGGTLNFHTGCLEVLKPVREKCCENQIAAKPPVFNCYAVIGSNLFHSNLSMLYCNVFLRICKAHSIAFDMKRKEGTVFTLYDSSERCRIGMIRAHEETVRDYVDETLRKRQSFHRIKMPPLALTVSEDLQGALVTFARNLSVIHQEISSSKMQGETNFKELIKDIENIQQMIVQNKLRAVKDKPAA